MRKIFSVFFLILLLTTAIFLVHKKAYSDELDDISKKISELSSALSSSKQATAPFLIQLTSMKKQLDGISNQVANTEEDIAQKKKIISQGYKDLGKQKELFNKTVRAYYIKNYLFSPLLVFLSSQDAQDATRLIAYQKKGSEDDKAVITNLAIKIVDLEERKLALEGEETRLQVIKQKLAAEKADVQKLVDGAVAYQTTLSSQIAVLSAKQQSILSSRLASLNIPRSAGTSARGCSDDRGVDPGFSPRIAFFSYGAPHRVGMNQYGAKGRADANQGRDDILKAYYANFEVTKWDTNIKIKVQGQGEFSLEDYTLRIYEMPESWPMAALEAQAIAARSFALAYTNNGAGEICTTEACQVFNSSPKTGAWAQAVKNTEGLVMTSGGNPIKAWYASTHGGYVFTSAEVWGGGTPYTKHATDTTTGNAGSFSELQSSAYDRESPWFYCDWGARGDKKTAWLKPSEVADIVNAILLGRADSSAGKHLYQTDKPNPEGTDTWNEDRVRQELQNKGITPFTNVSDISVSPDFGGGKTSSVNVSGNTQQSFSGGEFKNWFNLRAPANIQIVGPLFNVEKQ